MDHAEIWEQAKQLLREEVPSISYNTWIEQPLHPVYFEDGTLALEVTNDLYEQTIRSRYLQMIAEAVSRVAGQETKVRLMSIQERRAYQQQQEQDRRQSSAEDNMFNPKSTFETFVVGSSNQFAHAAALAVAEQPGQA